MNNFFLKSGLLFYFVGMLQIVMAQQNYEYEAWFDSNPPQTGSFSDTSELANLNLPIQDLSTGYHQVQIRFKRDSSPIWSSVSKRVFYKYPAEQPIAEAEYWWDRDWSNQYSFNLNSADSNQLITKSLNISHLSNGLHQLNIRYRGKAGSSSLKSQYFYKVGADSIWKIQRLEYWFDGDLVNPQTVEMTHLHSMHQQIPTTGLTVGLHQLHLRWVGSAGHTSVVTYPFYKSIDDRYWVTELHYWFDDNINNINRLPISNFSNDLLILNDLNVSNLTKGRHRVTIQYGGKAGWSSPQTRWFYKPEEEGIAYWFYQRNIAFTDTLRGMVPRDAFEKVVGMNKALYIQAKVPCDGWYRMGTRSKTALGWSSVAESDSIFLNAPFTLAEPRFIHTTCGEDTGKIVISPPRFGNNWQYALMNLSLPSQIPPFQSDTIFSGLKGDTYYKLRVRDASGCEMSQEFRINKNALPQKDTFITVCEKYRWIDTILDNNGIRIINDSLTTTGVYTRTLKSRRYSNCDSTVHLHLTVYRKVVKSIDTAICELDSLKFGNRWIKKDSTYIDNLHTWKGCDSIVTLRLHVNRLPRDTIRETICEGSVRIFGGARLDTFYTSGTYRDTIHRSTRCDSLVMLILKVNGRGRLTLLNRRCEGDTIKFVRLTDTLYLRKDTTLFTMQFRGCDSIFHRYEFVPKPSLTKDLVVEPRCLYSQTGRISLSLNRKRQDLQWEWLKGDTLFPRPTDVVWTADSQSLVISRLDTGRYLMRIMDNQICKDTLRLPILLEYQKFRIDSTKACKGLANGTARFVYNTKPNYSYKWQVNQPYSRIDTMVHLRAGRYVVTVWDDYTGKLCDSVRFQIPEVDTSVNYRQYTICYGDTLRAHDTIFTTKHQGHRMTVKRHDGLECDSIIFVTVNMRVSDQHLHLNASPRDTTIFLGDNATLKIEPNFKPIGIDWDPNKEVSCPSCPSLVTSPVREQWYSIKAQNDRKCWMSDSILVRVKRDLYTIPNAFYPTADDPLYTIYPDKAISKILKLTIFDRWGKHLYQIEKPLHGTKWGWDGKVDGMDMPQDVYRAIVEIELKDKTIEVKNQAFTLFR